MRKLQVSTCQSLAPGAAFAIREGMNAKRLRHLDRMASNPNLSPAIRERFRLAAWNLREALKAAK